MNTQKKLYLLPHRCQLIGWILIGFSLVFVIGSILILKNEDEQFTYAAGGMIISICCWRHDHFIYRIVARRSLPRKTGR